MATDAPLRLLLDLSYCLHLIKARPADLSAQLAHYQPGELGISTLTVAALVAQAQGTSDPIRNQRALEKFLLPLVVVEFDAGAARWVGAAGRGAWRARRCVTCWPPRRCSTT